MGITLEDAAAELRDAELSLAHWRRHLNDLPLTADPAQRRQACWWVSYYATTRDRWRTRLAELRRLRTQRIAASVRGTLATRGYR